MNRIGVCASAAALAAAGQAATAAVYEWTWDRGDPGSYSINDAAGHWKSIQASFDDQTNELCWTTTFSNTITSGLTLVVNGGPNPKGHPGELAVLYVDARDPNAPLLTAYGYNGQNASDSYRDGNGPTGGTQLPDTIKGLLDPSWVQQLQVSDAGGERTFTIKVDATDLNLRLPRYPDPGGDDWFGIGFGEQLGLWFHTFKGLGAAYNNDGYLTTWTKNNEGWFDGNNFTTTVVPLPTGAALGFAGLGVVAGVRRRRKA